MTKGTMPPKGNCPECFEDFWKTRTDRKFCSDRCKRAHHRRRETRAIELLDDAMKWRRTRAKGGFTHFCQLLDRYLAEDREREAAALEARKKSVA